MAVEVSRLKEQSRKISQEIHNFGNQCGGIVQEVRSLKTELPAHMVHANKNAHDGLVSQIKMMFQREADSRRQEISMGQQNCNGNTQRLEGFLNSMHTQFSQITDMAQQEFTLSQRVSGAVEGLGHRLHQTLSEVTS